MSAWKELGKHICLLVYLYLTPCISHFYVQYKLLYAWTTAPDFYCTDHVVCVACADFVLIGNGLQSRQQQSFDSFCQVQPHPVAFTFICIC